MGGSKVFARLESSAGAAQPFAVEQMRAGELHPHPRAAEMVDRFAIEGLGVIALTQERTRASLDAESPLSATRASRRHQPLESVGRHFRASTSDGGLNQLGEDQ